MRWKGRAGSRNVEDRRSVSGRAMIGGGGLVMVILAVVLTLLGGGDAGDALRVGVQQLQQQQAAPEVTGEAVDLENDAEAQFVSVVLRDTEDVWNQLFPRYFGGPYREPKLVLFRGAVRSACGQASSAIGPFYCPGDSRVYLDLTFFDEMRTKYHAPGDFASAYVIAHEVGHHVQNLLGLSERTQVAQQRASRVEANNLSVRLELQADFLAGVWAHHAQQSKQILESGDLDEAIRAAQAIGDDTLQRRSQGHIVPDAFTHGTSAQRIRWFRRGFESGDLEELNLLFEMDYSDL